MRDEVIFYGAGGNAKKNYKKWIAEGKKPCCFVDKDPKKQHTMFEDTNFEILPLYEALNKYPQSKICVTHAPENCSSVFAFLTCEVGIPEEMIIILEGNVSQDYQTGITNELQRIYDALQDDLSRELFLARINFSTSRNIAYLYKTIISDDSMNWLKGKQTYANERYGLEGLWEVLRDNTPTQKDELYLLIYDEKWNEFEWVVDRFMCAIPIFNIKIKACIKFFEDDQRKEYKGLPCITKEEFENQVNEKTKILVGFPGWCLEMRKVVEKFEKYKKILYPIADGACPQYVEPEFLIPKEDEVYVDVGVYDFQNGVDFIKWANKGFKKIYAFEPDLKQYKGCINRIGAMEDGIKNKIELINKGLSSKNGYLEFPAEYRGSGVYDSNDTIKVEVVTFDSCRKDDEVVSFIKMDVEGAEMDVLQGMKETIRKDKPRIAVCIYHKYNDVVDVSSFLLNLVPDYKFYIRHYNSNETETVLFCIA